MSSKRRIGIYAGGGPAPGINSVISAATIEAINSGWEVIGILDGFEYLARVAGRQAEELRRMFAPLVGIPVPT